MVSFCDHNVSSDLWILFDVSITPSITWSLMSIFLIDSRVWLELQLNKEDWSHENVISFSVVLNQLILPTTNIRTEPLKMFWLMIVILHSFRSSWAELICNASYSHYQHVTMKIIRILIKYFSLLIKQGFVWALQEFDLLWLIKIQE